MENSKKPMRLWKLLSLLIFVAMSSTGLLCSKTIETSIYEDVQVGMIKTGSLDNPNITGSDGVFEVGYRLIMSRTQRLDIRLNKTSGDLDPRLEIFGSQGDTVAMDGALGGDGNARIRITLTEGTYLLFVRHDLWTTKGAGNYELIVGASQPLTQVTLDTPLTGSLTGGGDFVLFDLVIEIPTVLDIHLDTTSGFWDPVIFIIDSRWNVISLDDDGGAGFNAWIRRMEIGVDIYTVLAFSAGGGGGYILHINPGINPPTINIGDIATGFFSADSAFLEFSFTLVQDDSLLFDLERTAGDLDLVLAIFEPGFGFRGVDDNSGRGADSLGAFLGLSLGAGDYLAWIEARTGSGDYRLSITEPTSTAAKRTVRQPIRDNPWALKESAHWPFH